MFFKLLPPGARGSEATTEYFETGEDLIETAKLSTLNRYHLKYN